MKLFTIQDPAELKRLFDRGELQSFGKDYHTNQFFHILKQQQIKAEVIDNGEQGD